MKKLALLFAVLSLVSASFAQTSSVRRVSNSSTDNTLVKHDGTSGKLVQDTAIVVDDSNNVTGVVNITATGTIEAANLTDDGVAIPSISSTSTLTNKTLLTGSNTIKQFQEKHASSHTLSAAECYGATYYVTAASVVLTLPAAADGMNLTVISNTANVVTVDANASDLIILDGTALDDGDSIDSAGAAGDIAVLTYYDATGWFASTNTWVDGGP